MSWRKRHTGFAGNPKIMAACLDAGPIAALLYDLLLDRHAEKSARDGRLAAHDVDAHSLLRVLSNFLPRGEVLEIKQVEGAFQALVQVGLLTRDSEGARINGWSRSWDVRQTNPGAVNGELSGGREEPVEATCLNCGDRFVQHRANHRYCSAACRKSPGDANPTRAGTRSGREAGRERDAS